MFSRGRALKRARQSGHTWLTRTFSRKRAPLHLCQLIQMLQEPHADNPLEADIARQLAEDKDAFNKTATKWTADFASP